MGPIEIELGQTIHLEQGYFGGATEILTSILFSISSIAGWHS
jgi:hypothetical protein